MLLPFFYQGYKPNRYYWEILIFFRKLAMVIFIVAFSTDIVNSVYTLIFVMQGALLIHLLFHPHVSGRQYRLELVSISSILATLIVGLYLIDNQDSSSATALSIILVIVHSLILVFFAFFILRGLLRLYLPGAWSWVRRKWKKNIPSSLKKNRAKLEKVNQFLQEASKSNDDERAKLFARIEKWWKNSPKYKRKRLVRLIRELK